MQIGSIIAIYFVIWWMTLFAVLPFGIRSQQESGDVVPGSDPGAPTAVRVRRVIVINSILSAVLLATFWFVYVENVFNIAIFNDITRR